MAKLSTNTGQTVDAGPASGSGPWREAWRTFRRNRLALAGLLIIVFSSFWPFLRLISLLMITKNRCCRTDFRLLRQSTGLERMIWDEMSSPVCCMEREYRYG